MHVSSYRTNKWLFSEVPPVCLNTKAPNNKVSLLVSDDQSIDLTGAGKVAEAIPDTAWVQLVDTACTTFKDVLSPLTSLTSGVGRLIESKFDRLVDAEKVLAAEMMNSANKKAKKRKKTHQSGRPLNANLMIDAIERSATETDPIIRELWSNLLAEEISEGDAHPEFARILGRLSGQDAQILAEIAEQETDKSVAFKKSVNSFIASISMLGISLEIRQNGSFNHEHLRSLGLIERPSGAWELTLTGKAFIQAVSDTDEVF